MNILEVKNLEVILKKNNKKIIKNINFSIEKNSCVGILGESGSGKSITCKSILNILNDNFNINGEIIFDGKNLINYTEKEMKNIRGKQICMILQNPMTSFDPLFTIQNQMVETFLEHLNISAKDALELAKESLEKMRMKEIDVVLKKYPHELSGGMLQRVMIAIAIALKPKLIIADEPTTAIDSLNQKDIIEEFKILKNEINVSILFVTHDLGVLSYLADKLIVMQNGEIVESGTTAEIINNHSHEHTNFLIETRRALMKRFKEVTVKIVLNDVSLSLEQGKCVGIIGESGSGKSTLGRIITGIEKADSGVVEFEGKNIHQKENRNMKNDISVVFQNYVSSVNPRFSVAQIIAEPLIISSQVNRSKIDKNKIDEEVKKLIKIVGLSEEFLERFPHELSGGQLQRVCIARAIVTKPKFILLDEAVSSLDVSTQVEILDLLQKLKKEYNLSYIFITHDLLTITYICDSVIFFKDGKIEEKIDDIRNLKNIKKDYSKKLLEAVIEF